MRSGPGGSADAVSLLRQSCRMCSRYPCHWREGEDRDGEVDD